MLHQENLYYKWIEASHGDVPPNSIAGGRESGTTLYVARTHCNNDIIPGKVY